MNKKKFKKTVKIEELVPTGDNIKFMARSRLNIPLRASNGRLFGKCSMAALGAITGDSIASISDTENMIKSQKSMMVKNLIEYFEKIIKEGKWIVSTSDIQFFDGEDKEILDEFPDMKNISRTIEITKVETLFIDKKRINKIRESK